METTHSDSQTILTGAAPVGVKQSGAFFTTSVAVWAVLAVLAAAYLAVLAIKPGAIAAYLPSATPEDNEGQRATTALSDTKDLRNNVEQLQVDVAKIKTELTEKSEQDKAVATRLAVLEETKRGGTAEAALTPGSTKPAGTASAGLSTAATPAIPVSALTPAATTAAAKAAAKKLTTAAAKAVPATAPVAALAPAPMLPVAPAAAPVAPAPVTPAANAASTIAPPLAATADAATPLPAGVKLINSPLAASSAASRAAPAPVAAAAPLVAAPAVVAPPAAPAPANAAEALAPKLETGSVQNLGAPPAPAASTAKQVGIYIGSGPSVDSLRLSWSLLSDRNAETLKPLEPRYTTGIDANGLNYGLVAGPVKSVADAQKLCKDLAAKAITCRVGDFTGEAL